MLRATFTLVLIYACADATFKEESSFRIAGLFSHQTTMDSEMVFKNIVDMKSSYHGDAIHPNVTDSYSISLEVCRSTEGDLSSIALLDARPTQGECDAVCKMSNRYHIPHLALGWQPTHTLLDDTYTFMYYPPPEVVSKAYSKLISQLLWDKFTILYEDDRSLYHVQEVINNWPPERKPILFRLLDPEGDNRETFKYIFKVARINYHILSCDVKNIHKYVEEILNVENSTQYQSIVLTALDAYTIDMTQYPGLMANVSTLHITTANDAMRWRDYGMVTKNLKPIETALTVDALNHLEMGIRTMIAEGLGDQPLSKKELQDLANAPSLCYKQYRAEYDQLAWSGGEILRKALLSTTVPSGFTGNIEFDDNGQRTNFVLYYSKLDKESKFQHTGQWESATDILTIQNDNIADRSSAYYPNSVLRVAARIGEPYFMMKQNETTDEVTYIGYSVDLINTIFDQINRAHKTDWKYVFYRVEGDKYGSMIEGTNKWDGMIGDLMEHKADLAICDLTITSERNDAVDFSMPFMSTGISILYREPDPDQPDRFSFMKPFALDVWLYLATSYILVSLLLLVSARMCPDDWVNPHPCNQNPENLENIWTLYNCMWLTMGSLMTQGCDILPRAAGSRWITSVWWFFVLIITASYTANMSAFISNNRRNNKIETARDLAEQNQVAYGAVYNASTYRFFEKSNDSVYSKMWTVMNSAKPTVFTTNNDEGRNRVLKMKGKYAFFMESTAIEYYMERNRELVMVGGLLDSKEYGIALPKKSPLKGYIDNVILGMQASGLTKLKNRWWKLPEDQKIMEEDVATETDSGLQMESTSGIFLLLGFGALIGTVAAIIDFFMHVNRIAVKERVTFKEAFISECRASLNPGALHKPAAPQRSRRPSTRSHSRERSRSHSRAVSVLRAAQSFINFDEIY